MARLKRLAREVDLRDTSAVEFFIYTLDVSNNYKNKQFLAYERFCKANAIPYNKPKKLCSTVHDQNTDGAENRSRDSLLWMSLCYCLQHKQA